MKTFFRISFLIALALLPLKLALAQSDFEKGVKLYEAGKNSEAVAVLEKASKQAKTDAKVWNALGLAYIKAENPKKATKPFEKAVEFDQQNAAYHTHLAYAHFLNGKLDAARKASSKAVEIDSRNAFAYYLRGLTNVWENDTDAAIADADKAIALNGDFAQAYTLKSDALHSAFGRRVNNGTKPIEAINLLQQANDVLEICLKKCRNNLQKEIQQERLETIQIFYKYFDKRRDENLSQINAAPAQPDPSLTPMKILSKKAAAFTDSAREQGISGTIRLLVFFSETGRVTHTLVLKGLGGGLTDSALNAARQIKFEPARKDGKPISQIKILEYSFSF